ncbi:MAG TPA: zinc ribbon domain-containing protein [Gammaproteobacteria bacterium]
MPFYEYQCQACGEHLETLQKISDPPLQDCPACGKPQLKKLVSAAGFRLKGGGWYETDFKSDKKRNLHDSAKADASPAKSDSKPESSGGSGGSSGSGGTSGDSGKKAAAS